MIFALYCPYWMVNKTGVSLSYKVRDEFGGVAVRVVYVSRLISQSLCVCRLLKMVA